MFIRLPSEKLWSRPKVFNSQLSLMSKKIKIISTNQLLPPLSLPASYPSVTHSLEKYSEQSNSLSCTFYCYLPPSYVTLWSPNCQLSSSFRLLCCYFFVSSGRIKGDCLSVMFFQSITLRSHLIRVDSFSKSL